MCVCVCVCVCVCARVRACVRVKERERQRQRTTILKPNFITYSLKNLKAETRPAANCDGVADKGWRPACWKHSITLVRISDWAVLVWTWLRASTRALRTLRLNYLQAGKSLNCSSQRIEKRHFSPVFPLAFFFPLQC